MRKKFGFMGGGVVALAAALTLLASPAGAVTPNALGSYSITIGSGAFRILTTCPQFAFGADDQTVTLTTNAVNACQRLPFPIKIYGSTKTSMSISTNGNVQFQSVPSTAFSNDCLPSSTILGKAIFPLWDDLIIGSMQPSENVYTRVSGSGTHHTFIVSWQVQDFSTGNLVNAQLVFKQGSQNYRTVYGPNTDGGSSATIGIQANVATATQFSCNQANSVRNGLALTFTHRG